MPTIDFTPEEHAAPLAVVRRAIDNDRFPMSPRLDPLKSALMKLDPTSVPKAVKPKPPLREGDKKPIHANYLQMEGGLQSASFA